MDKSFIIVLGILLFSCNKKEDVSPVPPVQPDILSGRFISSAHPTSGITCVNFDTTQLKLKNFRTDSGPDLNIYLASSISDIQSDYIDLGDIKGINGNYSYTLNKSIDLSTYKYVVIWCVDFNVNFGYAQLEK